MTFRYGGSFSAANTLQGYERLLRDAMLGDQSCSHVTSGTARRTCG
jgi:glucose-6-phosphate 1-dehydrogenase